MLGKIVSPALKKLEENFIGDGGSFKEIEIGKLFDIHPTKSYGMTNDKLFKTKGNTPVIVNSSFNNGIGGFVDLAPTEKGNMITYSDTTTSEAIFYQSSDFIGYSHVQGLYPYDEKNWDRKTYLYFLAVFKKSAFGKFNYGNKFNRNIAKELMVILPYNKENKIDFEFMRAYISKLEEERISELDTYIKVSGLDNYELSNIEEQSLLNQQGVPTSDFRIGDLFEVETGRDVIISNVKNGNIPLISHQHLNNGISKYIEKLNNRKLFNFEKTIPVADRGVFLATTQISNFHIGTRVKALTFKSGNQNEEIRLYFVTAINKLQMLFKEYSDNATYKFPDLKIKLPINKNNEIDYEFMENYIKAIEKKVIKNVILWKDSIIEKAKDCIQE